MTEQRPESSGRSGISRRRFLGLAGGASAAVILGGCSQGTPQTGSTGAGGTATQGGSDPVTLRWVDSQAGPKSYNEKVFAEFEKQHPNVKVEYTLVPVAERAAAVQAFLQSDDPPDIFAAPSDEAARQMIAEGVVQPLDPYVTEEWKETFPPATFIEGAMMFNGEIYSYPHSGTRQSEGLLWYNKAAFEQAGLDPEQPPATWDELRDFSSRIVDAGGGQAFGLVLQGKLTISVGHLATVLATASGGAFGPIGGGRSTTGGIDWHTGEYVFSSDRYVEAVEFLRSLDADGLLFPGWPSLSPQDAMQRLAQGNAGMFSWGSYVVGQLENAGNYPDFPLGFAPPPTADGSRHHLNTDVALPSLLLHADSKAPEAAGQLIMFRSSREYFEGYVEEVQVQPSPLPEVNEQADVTPEFKAAASFFEEWIRFQPLPAGQNPDQSKVLLEMKPVEPNFHQIITAAISGEIADPRAALRELDDKLTADRERAIAAVRDSGSDVSVDDWVFPNWDPSEDYDADFYAEL